MEAWIESQSRTIQIWMSLTEQWLIVNTCTFYTGLHPEWRIHPSLLPMWRICRWALSAIYMSFVQTSRTRGWHFPIPSLKDWACNFPLRPLLIYVGSAVILFGFFFQEYNNFQSNSPMPEQDKFELCVYVCWNIFMVVNMYTVKQQGSPYFSTSFIPLCRLAHSATCVCCVYATIFAFILYSVFCWNFGRLQTEVSPWCSSLWNQNFEHPTVR
jgi:hypothetical protein